MTTPLRRKLARWLAPDVFESLNQAIATRNRCIGLSQQNSEIAVRRAEALRLIAAQRTPGSNATVRRICDIADAELGR